MPELHDIFQIICKRRSRNLAYNVFPTETAHVYNNGLRPN